METASSIHVGGKGLIALPVRKRIDDSFELLTQSDALIAKAAGISEVAQIARAETRLREYFEAKWNELKKQAVDEAVKMAVAGKSPSAISSKVISILNKWSGQVEKKFTDTMTSIYQNARTASFRKTLYRSNQDLTYDTPNFTEVKKANIPRAAVVLPMFDVADARAIEALEEQQMFWVKAHIDKNLSNTIRDNVKATMVEAGKGRVEAGRLLRERLTRELGQVRTPEGWHGSQKQYFEGLAANAATTARVQGHMRSFIDLGVKKYEIMNPQDERTCPVCSMMNGKVFTVKQGMKVVEQEMAATNPDQVKEAHPWYNTTELKQITSGPGNQGADDSAALAAAGYSVPPFHFRCRCTVSVSEEAGSFEDIVEEPPKPPPPAGKPPAWKPTMTQSEAKKYTHSSRLPQAFFHASRLSAGSIQRAGLIAVPDSVNRHKGILLSPDRSYAIQTTDGTKAVTTAHVNAKNPLRVDDAFWAGKSSEQAHLAVYESLPSGVNPAKASAGQLSKAAQKAGYDSWYSIDKKGKVLELRAFDKKQVAVFRVEGL